MLNLHKTKFLYLFTNLDCRVRIIKVLISSEEITNFCQESVKSELSLELNEKLNGDYLFNDIENLYKKLFIYKEFKIKNNNCSMINLIYLCFNANSEEKKEIYEVLISSQEITNFCQESVKSELSLELNEKLKGDYLFNDVENLYKKLFIDKEGYDLKNNESSNQISKKNPSYINVLKIINNYFNN